MEIKEGMAWPPNTILDHEMKAHSAWYSGNVELLSGFYGYTDTYAANQFGFPKTIGTRGTFWGRQVRNDNDICVHVPIAGDIAETSANFLFAESPIIRIKEEKEDVVNTGKPLSASSKANSKAFAASQEALDDMLVKSGFYRKILEAAEACAAMGGIYIKIAYDEELSPYPIPVVMQADRAVPEFAFGILKKVTFWKNIDMAQDCDLTPNTTKQYYRLFEQYEIGHIYYTLYEGTSDKLGRKVDLNTLEQTQDLIDDVKTPDAMLAIYIPNVLPNRLDRNSYSGRSDYSGVERLMDALDETFSSWMRDIVIAQGKVFIPECYLQADSQDGKQKFNVDQNMYVKLDIDPTALEGQKITAQQFAIRAAEFEKTSMNLLERIITSAGYSPQSFGLTTPGRSESGTALALRERKSFATKGKKENYWQDALLKIVNAMMIVYAEELGGEMDLNAEVNIAFSDGMTNDLSETSSSIKLISDAAAASTSTKVRMLHPEWSEDQVAIEVKLIADEASAGSMPPPDGSSNMDINQMDAAAKAKAAEEQAKKDKLGGGKGGNLN